MNFNADLLSAGRTFKTNSLSSLMYVNKNNYDNTTQTKHSSFLALAETLEITYTTTTTNLEMCWQQRWRGSNKINRCTWTELNHPPLATANLGTGTSNEWSDVLCACLTREVVVFLEIFGEWSMNSVYYQGTAIFTSTNTWVSVPLIKF